MSFYREGTGPERFGIQDTAIVVKEAFKIYSRRWIVEVAPEEMKCLLNLGKPRPIDFAGQIVVYIMHDSK